MELTAAIAVIIAAAIVPFGTALLTRPDMPAARKRVLAGVVALVAAAIVTVATGQVEGLPPSLVAWSARALVVAGIIVSLAQGYYRAFKGAVDRIEAATSPAAPDAE